MRISRLSEKITIQKNETVVDQYGNHLNTWTDYYSCHAYASTYKADEKEDQITDQEEKIVFSVRYCIKLRDMTSTKYRVVFNGTVYNIRSIDQMNFNRKEVRLTCEKEPGKKAVFNG